MNCRSCRAQLGARDQKCPSCGRRNQSGATDLGSGQASDSGRHSDLPLPPARGWNDGVADERSSDMKTPESKKAPEPKKTPPRRTVEEPVRLTEFVRPKQDPGSSGSGATRPTSAGPGRDEVRDLLAERPELIESGLRVHREDGGAKGVGYATPVGDIDLLARDSASAWVLVLLPERSREKELVGHLLELMGWVRKHLGEPGQEVRAIALLDWVPENLGYAAAAVAGSVEFKRYKLELTFEQLQV